MSTEPTSPAVTHNVATCRFEIALGEAVARLDYSIDDSRMTIHHTFVPEELRGQSIAGLLAAAAFEFARKEGLQVVPACSYIGVYARRHPEAMELIAQ